MSERFSAPAWAAQSNIYEVNVRQYTPEGTFVAFAAHLPRLRDMGVEILWFMPVTPISVAGRLGTLGSYYACSDYCAVNPEFGAIEDLAETVRQAHALGMKVIIDWVADHTGHDHRWTREHPDFYLRNTEGNFYDSHGWNDVIDLNYDNADLRAAMIGAMGFWIDRCDIDGFRCDMAMLVPLSFWATARETLDARKELFWLAECEDPAYHEVFDASYTWKFLHAMEDYWRRAAGIGQLYDVLDYYNGQFVPSAIRAFFTTNHDENSHSGSEYERLGDSAKTFAVFCATWNGVPLIYSGQEIPNTKRLLFFDKDQIDWSQPCTLHDFFKTLLALRRRNTALSAGSPSSATILLGNDRSDRVMTFLRRKDDRAVLVALNLSWDANDIVITHATPLGGFRNVFTGEEVSVGAQFSLRLDAWGFAVFEQ